MPLPIDSQNLARDLDWAMSMLLHESDHYWKRFNTILVSNSVTMAATFSLKESDPFLSSSLHFFGLILCGIWYLSTARGVRLTTFYKHWIGSHSQHTSLLINDAANLSFGHPVTLTFRGVDTTHKLTLVHPILKNNFYPYALITLFSLLYISLAIYSAYPHALDGIGCLSK